ncbi:AsnC family transcriptional regulator [Candidatus Woesearchaeota archaeon]|nr:AsnC family transcriptional regulator [Candidatus Woesearchaeota archaeon]
MHITHICEDKIKLDLNDKKILKELDLNSRQSNTAIAKATRLSKNIVNYRIKRMEDEGIIEGYTTTFDYSKLGYLLVRVYFDFYETDQKKEDELINFLINDQKTSRISRASGKWDVIASFFVKDIYEFSDHWSKILGRFRSLIKEYSSNIITRDISFRKAYLIGETEDISHLSWKKGCSTPEQIDETDLIILKMLTENARMPIEKIAASTGLGSMAIIYRIKQLIKKKIILGYRVNINFSKLGYEFYKVNLELEDTTIIPSLIEYCHRHPNIISVVESISDNIDFEFNIEPANFNDFLKVIDDLKQKFYGKIRDYNYVKSLKSYKHVYLPLDTIIKKS